MSLFTQFKTDVELEQQGVWLNFGTVEIKVARSGGGNVEFAKVSARYFEPHRRALELKILDEAVALAALIEIFADCVILAWRTKTPDGYIDTIEGPSGEQLSFNKPNVVMVMSAIPELFRLVRQYSEDWQNYKASLREIATKN